MPSFNDHIAQSNTSQPVTASTQPNTKPLDQQSCAAGYGPAGAPRKETIHSMHRRCAWHNYHERGIYMLTICVADRKPLLGVLYEDGVSLTALGTSVTECIGKISAFYPEAEVMAHVIMPDHVHLLIQIHENMGKRHLGMLVSGFVLGCNRAYWNSPVFSQSVTTSTQPSQKSTHPHLQPGAAASRALQSSAAGYRPAEKLPSLFEKGYHDRILTHSGQLTSMVAYVRNNPCRAWIKRQNPELFRLRRNISLSSMQFSAMGNHFLLDYADKQVIECSRSLSSDAIMQLTEETLARAEQGAVTISAGISEGERRVAKAIREAGYPLVMILKDGFPPAGSEMERFFKPQGVYFETCASGQLLLLEATEETFTLPFIQQATEQTLQRKALEKHHCYSPLPTSSLRYRFVAQNEMAKRL